jgi:hypothetical protein
MYQISLLHLISATNAKLYEDFLEYIYPTLSPKDSLTFKNVQNIPNTSLNFIARNATYLSALSARLEDITPMAIPPSIG